MMNRLRGIASVALILVIAGCAAPPKQKEEAVFFPSPPELPRIQYLTSFTYTRDIEEQSAFQRFVLGEKEIRRLDKPYGVGIYDGKIYVCDTNNTVIVLDLKAKTYETLKGARGQGKLVQPINISIEEDGTKYVADAVRGQVVVFDRNDDYVKSYGIVGKWRPVDAVAFEDRLYVADSMNEQVRVFDKRSGEMVKTIGNTGELSDRLIIPGNLAFDREGYLYVSDAGRFQVVKFDRDGHLISMFGKAGDNIGNFARPRGIALDREGRLYVVDAVFNNLQIFNKDRRLLLYFGQGGYNRGDYLIPAKVAIDYKNMQYFQKYVEPNFDVEYLIIVTSQFGHRMVNVLGYGKEKGKTYPTEEELLKTVQEKIKRELEKSAPPTADKAGQQGAGTSQPAEGWEKK